jgi:hypothetical protein
MLVLSCSVQDQAGSEVDAKTSDVVLETDDAWLEGDLALSDEDDDGSPIVSGGEYPQNELFIKILSPSGSISFATSSGVLNLSGIVFSKPEQAPRLSWVAKSSDDGQVIAQGDATGSPFWTTEEIQLRSGDNLITVTASAGDEIANDQILVTYNPSFPFPGAPVFRPPAIFTNEKIDVVATIAISPLGQLVDNYVVLVEADATGKIVGTVGQMLDDGMVERSGDEVLADGVFSLKFSYVCSQPNPVYFRVLARTKDDQGNIYVAKSALTRFDCIAHLAEEVCASHQRTLAQARQAYLDALSQNLGVPRAKAKALEVFQADTNVVEMAKKDEEGGLWVRFSDGVLGALNVADKDVRGGGDGGESGLGVIQSFLSSNTDVQSKAVLALSPFYSDFKDDEASFVADTASPAKCPSFTVFGQSGAKGFQDAGAGLKAMRMMNMAGVVAIATHSEVYFASLSESVKSAMGVRHKGAMEVLWTGEAVNCGGMSSEMKTCKSSTECPQGAECLVTQAVIKSQGTTQYVDKSGVCYDATQVDLMTGRVVLGAQTYGVTPAFIEYLGRAQRFPSSLVYLGGCKTLWNGSLASAFLASGAKTIVGYTGKVTNRFAKDVGQAFFTKMLEEGMTAGSAYGVGVQDPANPGSYLRLLGSKKLSFSNATIINESFEAGDLSAWQTSGDARVIWRFGETKPSEGKFMALISTGLGFTDLSGEIDQRFCIPEGAQSLSFRWKYYSAEFNEWCGSPFQDTFAAQIVPQDGVARDIVRMAVDDLCFKDCNKVCQCYKDTIKGCPSNMGSKFLGLSYSDVQYEHEANDTDGVWMTGWQEAQFDVSQWAGKDPVTLKFFCTDKGDSILDTVVLIDDVKIR